MKSLILLFLAGIKNSISRGCDCGKIQEPGQYYRIHRGLDTARWKHPWQILIEILIFDQSDILRKSNSGVLISKKHIVTCAKCLQDFYEEKLSYPLTCTLWEKILQNLILLILF